MRRVFFCAQFAKTFREIASIHKLCSPDERAEQTTPIDLGGASTMAHPLCAVHRLKRREERMVKSKGAHNLSIFIQ